MSTNGHFEPLPDKSLYRIGEVSRLTDTKPFVLRYWETEFPMLQPVKSPKGHRLYRREDVQTVLHIKRLLYDEGFTIAGARRHLTGNGGVTPEAGNIDSGSPSELLFSDESLEAPRAPISAAPPAVYTRSVAPVPPPAAPMVSRQVLLDLRDSLRAFLTLLETE